MQINTKEKEINVISKAEKYALIEGLGAKHKIETSKKAIIIKTTDK